MKLRPLNKWVTVKPDPPREFSESGIYIAGIKSNIPPTGKVIDVGDLVEELKINDTVIYPSHAVPVYKEKEIILIREDELLGMLK